MNAEIKKRTVENIATKVLDSFFLTRSIPFDENDVIREIVNYVARSAPSRADAEQYVLSLLDDEGRHMLISFLDHHRFLVKANIGKDVNCWELGSRNAGYQSSSEVTGH